MVGVTRSRYLNDCVTSTLVYCVWGRYYCRCHQPSPTEFAEGVRLYGLVNSCRHRVYHGARTLSQAHE